MSMKKWGFYLLSSVLLVGTVACNDGARTGTVPTETNTDQSVVDSQTNTETEQPQSHLSETRRNQLNADIRAREQRNEVAGNPQERAERDLESEVRSKLEANLPGSALVVKADEQTVIITGTVASAEHLQRIEPLAREIRGVEGVNVNAQIDQQRQS